MNAAQGFLKLQNSASVISFNPAGEVLDWILDGRTVVLNRPVRQNTRTDWQGIQVWVKSLDEDPANRWLLPRVEYSYVTEKLEIEGNQLLARRRGAGWILDLTWTLEDRALLLKATVHAELPDKYVQLESLCWAPCEFPQRGNLEGKCGHEEWNYEIPRYGVVVARDLDRGSSLSFQSASGYRLTMEPARETACTHMYHRGISLKLGSTSEIAVGGKCADLDLEFSVRNCDFHTYSISQDVSLPEKFPGGQARDYSAGLMLHLQYTQEAQIFSRLEKWIVLARKLGFDFLILELNRALRIHPYCAKEALTLDAYSRLAELGSREGISVVPCFNLLGHQFETGLLEWKPEWRESEFDGLCASNPEVRQFALGPISQVLEAFHTGWMHVGGDELKLPYDKSSPKCSRCGSSPNLERIVEYWNFLQSSLPENKHLAIWGDQLLPPEKIAPGLTGHNWEGNAEKHLSSLDRRVHILNWQYGETDPASAQDYLRQGGHSVGLASGQYFLQNPFIHAEYCRGGGAPLALHTTWASPHPADCPLESVAAAALAHAGERFDADTTPAKCRQYAEWMFAVLTD